MAHHLHRAATTASVRLPGTEAGVRLWVFGFRRALSQPLLPVETDAPHALIDMD